MEEVGSQQIKQRRRRLEDQSLYERHNDSVVLFFWLLLVAVQWNYIGETLDILEASQQSDLKLKIGIVGEIVINILFCLDFFLFKKQNSQNLELYSNTYLAVDFLSGPVALIGDIISLIFTGRLNIYSTVFRSMKALSVVQARRVFTKVGQILPRVKDMFLCLFCVFYLFTYIATYLYGNLFRSSYYFNNIGFGFFTMLQIMTLDGWGEVGREVLRQQGMISASFLIIFVFIQGYFFWNILIGFILEILRSFEEKKGQESDHSLIKGISSAEIEQIEEDNEIKQVSNSESIHSAKDLSISSNNKVELLDYSKNQQKSPTKKGQKKAKHSNEDIALEEINDTQRLIEQQESETFLEQFCFGALYNKIVLGLYFLVLLNSLFNYDLQSIDGPISEALHTTTSFIYTLHTIFIYTQNGQRFQLERKHTWMMFFHIVSGPLALTFDIFTLSTTGTIGFGGILKLLKVFTATRETIMGAVMIFPTLLPAFIGIISIIFLLALWALHFIKSVENYWVDFNTSCYTFVQILTLDDWAARLIKDLLRQDKYLTPVVFVGFIFVANYFFLNMMIAFSCETFKKVTNEDYVYRKQRKTVDFYEKEDKGTGPYHSLKELYSDLEVIKDTHINKQAFSYVKDIGNEKELSANEKHIFQLILEAKYGAVHLSSPITFTYHGKTVTLRQKDLQHLKFDLCDASVDEPNSKENNYV